MEPKQLYSLRLLKKFYELVENFIISPSQKIITNFGADNNKIRVVV